MYVKNHTIIFLNIHLLNLNNNRIKCLSVKTGLTSKYKNVSIHILINQIGWHIVNKSPIDNYVNESFNEYIYI